MLRRPCRYGALGKMKGMECGNSAFCALHLINVRLEHTDDIGEFHKPVFPLGVQR